MAENDSLAFQDLVNAGRLKRFRMRSLANPNWVRDPDRVLTYLTRGVAPTVDEGWPDGSPLAEWIDAAVTQLEDYRTFSLRARAARRGGKDKIADERWTAVLRAIDDLITEAEKRHHGPVWRWDSQRTRPERSPTVGEVRRRAATVEST